MATNINELWSGKAGSKVYYAYCPACRQYLSIDPVSKYSATSLAHVHNSESSHISIVGIAVGEKR